MRKYCENVVYYVLPLIDGIDLKTLKFYKVNYLIAYNLSLILF